MDSTPARLARRQALARVGCPFDRWQGLWPRRDVLSLTEEDVDALVPCEAYIRRWTCTRHPVERGRMERWHSTLTCERQALARPDGRNEGSYAAFAEPIKKRARVRVRGGRSPWRHRHQTA